MDKQDLLREMEDNFYHIQQHRRYSKWTIDPWSESKRVEARLRKLRVYYLTAISLVILLFIITALIASKII